MKTYGIEYVVDGVSCKTEVEAPDEMTALFIAGSQVSLTRSQRIRTRVVAFSSKDSPRL